MPDYQLGAIPSPEDKRDLLWASAMPVLENPLPSVYSTRGRQTSPPMQQFGSCVGFTIKAMQEHKEMASQGFEPEATILAGKFAYAECKKLDGLPGQSGTYPRIGMKVLCGIGICEEKLWPNDTSAKTESEYTAEPSEEALENAAGYMSGGYVVVETLQELKEAIDKYDVVAMCVPVYDSFFNADFQGKIAPGTGTIYGYHEIMACGWNDEENFIEFKNSWGTGWGDHGYGKLPYNYRGQSTVPFMEAHAAVDFVTGEQTTGGPASLALPVNDPFVVTQNFGNDFQKADGSWMYKSLGIPGHNGTDIRAKDGDPIFSCDSGLVIFSGVKGGYGNCVIIKHSWGTTLYGHLSDIMVSDDTGKNSIGKRVKLGKAGHTGNVTAAHLHLGMTINGVSNPAYKNYIDPLPYLKGALPMNIPDKGLALLADGKTEIVYFKIHNPNEMQGIVALSGYASPAVIPPVSKIDTLATTGYVLGSDSRTVIFYHKLASQAEQNLFVQLFKIPAQEALPPASVL